MFQYHVGPSPTEDEVRLSPPGGAAKSRGQEPELAAVRVGRLVCGALRGLWPSISLYLPRLCPDSGSCWPSPPGPGRCSVRPLSLHPPYVALLPLRRAYCTPVHQYCNTDVKANSRRKNRRWNQHVTVEWIEPPAVLPPGPRDAGRSGPRGTSPWRGPGARAQGPDVLRLLSVPPPSPCYQTGPAARAPTGGGRSPVLCGAVTDKNFQCVLLYLRCSYSIPLCGKS
jgi:hypothetical protein